MFDGQLSQSIDHPQFEQSGSELSDFNDFGLKAPSNNQLFGPLNYFEVFDFEIVC